MLGCVINGGLRKRFPVKCSVDLSAKYKDSVFNNLLLIRREPFL